MSERMNKEQAIEILKNLEQEAKVDEPELKYTDEQYTQALDIAIKCIEHEEKCNKAINDSTKAIAEMERLCAKCQVNNEWVDIKDRLPKEEEKYYLVDTDYGIEIMKWHENPLSKISNGNGGYKNVWEFEIDDFENKAYKERFINAWKPLPQPYERKE